MLRLMGVEATLVMGGDPGDGGMIYISGGEESNSEGPFVLHSGEVGAPGLLDSGGKTNER